MHLPCQKVGNFVNARQNRRIQDRVGLPDARDQAATGCNETGRVSDLDQWPGRAGLPGAEIRQVMANPPRCGDNRYMSLSTPRSLRALLLSHELAFVLLMVLLASVGGAWAYFWQQSSKESIRLAELSTTAQDLRTDLYRQIKEVSVARLMERPDAQELYQRYADAIEEKFNRLRGIAATRDEDHAIQAMSQAYRLIQQDMLRLFRNPYLLNRAVRLRLLDPAFEQAMVGRFERAFRSLQELIRAQREALNRTTEQWTRLAPVVIPLPILIAVVLLVLSRRSLVRGFVRPMQSLMEGARRISNGDLATRVEPDGVEEVRQLAEALNQMAAELEQSQAALLQAERQAALGALVPVVAHNIRNPLASIRATAQVLDEQATAGELMETREAIMETVDRLGRWVNALVSYLHPLKPRLRECTLEGMLRDVINLLQPRLDEKGISVDDRQARGETPVLADRDLMEQALYGLLSNAVDASPAGATLHLSVSTRPGGDVVLVMEDEGPGMPFTPRPSDLEPGPSSKRFGTGLGIPIAFKVCQTHGWELVFENREEGGTRVTITIPREAATRQDSAGNNEQV
ncbi:MAG: sensor histidine kinase [Gammaproteobacteria bacterium]|nr:MAG: sensor histidine kinase [Gammaproteobacteria bacterium]